MTKTFTERLAETMDMDHPWVVEGRIPLLTDLYTRWQFEVALVVPSEQGVTLGGWKFLEPTAEEAGLVADLINYRRSYYSYMWTNRMLERPLDIDDTTNTIVLAKMEHSWVYLRTSWRSGPPFLPTLDAEVTYDSLADLIDSIYRHGDGSLPTSFAEWKANRTIPVLPDFSVKRVTN